MAGRPVRNWRCLGCPMARAENALEQLRKHGKDRTVAFCVSQRHADFMAVFFREQGLAILLRQYSTEYHR
jgi:hypothetical protein